MTGRGGELIHIEKRPVKASDAATFKFQDGAVLVRCHLAPSGVGLCVCASKCTYLVAEASLTSSHTDEREVESLAGRVPYTETSTPYHEIAN